MKGEKSFSVIFKKKSPTLTLCLYIGVKAIQKERRKKQRWKKTSNNNSQSKHDDNGEACKHRH